MNSTKTKTQRFDLRTMISGVFILKTNCFHFTLLDVGCFEKIAIIATSIFGSGNSITDADDSRGDKEAA